MKYIYSLEPTKECEVKIVFGRYAKKGQYYYAVPESQEDLLQILKFEMVGFRNVELAQQTELRNGSLK